MKKSIFGVVYEQEVAVLSCSLSFWSCFFSHEYRGISYFGRSIKTTTDVSVSLFVKQYMDALKETTPFAALVEAYSYLGLRGEEEG